MRRRAQRSAPERKRRTAHLVGISPVDLFPDGIDGVLVKVSCLDPDRILFREECRQAVEVKREKSERKSGDSGGRASISRAHLMNAERKHPPSLPTSRAIGLSARVGEREMRKVASRGSKKLHRLVSSFNANQLGALVQGSCAALCTLTSGRYARAR